MVVVDSGGSSGNSNSLLIPSILGFSLLCFLVEALPFFHPSFFNFSSVYSLALSLSFCSVFFFLSPNLLPFSVQPKTSSPFFLSSNQINAVKKCSHFIAPQRKPVLTILITKRFHQNIKQAIFGLISPNFSKTVKKSTKEKKILG